MQISESGESFLLLDIGSDYSLRMSKQYIMEVKNIMEAECSGGQ